MNKESEFTEKEFVLHWFKDYLKQQYSALSSNWYNSRKDEEAKKNGKGQDDDEWSKMRNYFEQRSKSKTLTKLNHDNLCLSEYEVEQNFKRLESICCKDDIDLLNLEDISSSNFIQNMLIVMKPDEFMFDNKNKTMNPYIQILYQVKHFLDKRKFKAVSFLKNIKSQFESSKDDEDTKWEIVRLTVFVAFLVSAIKQELNFDDIISIKPNLIKGLVFSLNEVLLKLDSNLDDSSLSYSFVETQPKFNAKASSSVVLSRRNSAEPFGKSIGATNYDTDAEECFVNYSPFNNEDRTDFVNHDDVFDMKDYELDNSPEEHKCTDNDVHDNYLQVPAFFDDNEHLYSQRVRKTINHVGIRTHKECTGSSSFVHPKHADHQKISFATSLNSQSQKRDLMLIKKYQDKISHLHEKNCQLRKENQELSESLKDEAERNSYLVNENNRLYYLQHSVENLSYSLRCKKVQVKDLSEQLSSMLEQMSRSENCISKFVKVVKDQDEIYTSSIKFHKDSEVVLQDYYNQKLTSCLQKYEELNNKDQVEQEIQTDSFYDEAVRECLNEHKQIQITKLENTEKLKSKYACLFQESVANLKESVKQCKTLEDKLRSKRRVSRNEKSALIQSYNSTFKSNHLQETFMIIFIFVSLGIQLIFKI